MNNLVILESPFSADTSEELERNLQYARAAVRDSLLRGESPFPSHLLYTQEGILDDNDPEQRRFGIRAGLEWLRVADRTVVYRDLGITRGMDQGIYEALRAGKQVEYRNLPGWTKKEGAQ